MLEIAVRLNNSQVKTINGNSYKKRGDIIVAKIFPAVWGKDEKKYFLITYLNDPELESYLRQRQKAAGNPTIMAVLPYRKDKTAIGRNGNIRHELVNQSTKRVDVDRDFKNKIEDIDNKEKSLDKVKPDNKENLELSDLFEDTGDRILPKRGEWLRQ